MSVTLVPLPWVLTHPTKGWGEKRQGLEGLISFCLYHTTVSY